MPTGIKIYKTKDFIRRTETGDIDLERSISMVHDLTKAAQYHKDRNLLIDLRDTRSALNAAELLQVALEFTKFSTVFKNKIAFLMPDEAQRMENARFLKNLLELREFELETFTGFEDAIEWLSDVTALDASLD